MTNYSIKNAFQLQSANKLMEPGTYFNAETPEQEAELQSFCVDGSCSAVPTKPVAAPVDPNADAVEPQLDPSDDLSVVPGVGKRTEEKLNGAGINTLSGLKAAILDTSQTDAMTALLGLNYDKILTYFQTA